MTASHNIAAHQTEALLFFTLLQLTVIVVAARIGGEIAVRIGQSGAVGEIIVGILLGPSLFSDLGVISQQMFTILVIMAIFSTVVTSPLLRRWLPRIGIPVPPGSWPPQHAPHQQNR